MALEPARGGITTSKERLASVLAACTAFQDLVSANNAPAARARIHFDHEPEPAATEYTSAELAELYPCAVIVLPTDRFAYYRRSRADYTADDAGSLIINLYAPIDSADRRQAEEARRKFELSLELILSSDDPEEITLDNQNGPGDTEFPWELLSVVAPRRKSDVEEVAQLDMFHAQILVDWGTR